MSLLEYLIEKKVITAEESAKTLQEAKESGADVELVLVKNGKDINELMKQKGAYYGVPFRLLEGKKVDHDILKYIPEESARHYRIAPIGVVDGVLEVGITDPDNIQARDAVQFISSKTGMPHKLYLLPQSDMDEILSDYKNLSGEVTKALSELETEISGSVDEVEGVVPGEISEIEKEEEQTQIIEEAPVTKIVAVILKHATEGNASDVHIEHTGEKVRVRFRVDGVMYTSLLLPVNVHSAVVARIKILSNLRLDEKRKPQDGRFSTRIEGRKIDFRVSTFPAYYGEKVVLRILDPSKGVKPLDEMGFTETNLTVVRNSLKRPYGLILVTGPTGSGKSTTLYAMLNELDREKKNVISLEDPVEYNVPGMNQSQVRPEIGYTFASGLRSILRQDPDIIMVGEIRDKETAQLAVQAALTGHLVFSTLHTNTSAGVIPRLIDMGVDPYLIAPTLILAIGQRLARMICPKSKHKIPIQDSVRVMIEKQFSDLPQEFREKVVIPEYIYEAIPSSACPAGTKGRMAVFEMLEMDKEIESVVLKNPVEQEVYKAARNKGMYTMKEDALLKAFEGVIPFEEVNKV